MPLQIKMATPPAGAPWRIRFSQICTYINLVTVDRPILILEEQGKRYHHATSIIFKIKWILLKNPFRRSSVEPGLIFALGNPLTVMENSLHGPRYSFEGNIVGW